MVKDDITIGAGPEVQHGSERAPHAVVECTHSVTQVHHVTGVSRAVVDNMHSVMQVRTVTGARCISKCSSVPLSAGLLEAREHR